MRYIALCKIDKTNIAIYCSKARLDLLLKTDSLSV